MDREVVQSKVPGHVPARNQIHPKTQAGTLLIRHGIDRLHQLNRVTHSKYHRYFLNVFFATRR